MSRQSSKAAMHRKQFIIPDEIRIPDIKLALGKKFTCVELPAITLQRTFLDTFDWRTHAIGGVIKVESGANHATMSLLDFASDVITSSAITRQTVRFVWDLPPGKLRSQLEPLLEMRALLPLVKTRCKLNALNVMNRDEKTVVRLAIEETQLLAAHKTRHDKFPVILRIEPVKGYSEAFNQVVQNLTQQFALEPDTHSPAQRAFNAAHLLPGNYSSRLDCALTHDMRADEATRSILHNLLNTMQANEAGMIADIDSEFLHDYRVAVRRARSLLGQIKSVLPQPKQERFNREFAWLGEITGPTRDMDVYLLDFDTFKSSLPPPLKQDINPFHDFLANHRKLEQQRMVKHLGTARYRKIIADLQAYLNSPLPARASQPNAMRPAIEVANERIWRMVRRVMNEGSAIHHDSPPEALHDLRKSCKKLRYLMEFFLCLYPQHEIKQLVNALKSLQGQLGDYQDLFVQLESLAVFRTRMIAEKIANERTLVAFDLIMQTIEQRQAKVRELFKSRFSAFADPKNREEFAKLFNPGTSPKIKAKPHKEPMPT